MEIVDFERKYREIIAEEMKKIIEENRAEIVRRAHQRIKQLEKESRTQDEQQEDLP